MKVTITIETYDNTVPVEMLAELVSHVDDLSVNLVSKPEKPNPVKRTRGGVM